MIVLASSLWLAAFVVLVATSDRAADWHRTTRVACTVSLLSIAAGAASYAFEPGVEPVPLAALGTLLGSCVLGALLFSRHAALIERLQSSPRERVSR